MRNKVSEKKRRIIFAISAVITLLVVSFLIVKINSFTKFLEVDISGIDISCVESAVLSDGNIETLIPESLISDVLISDIQSAEGEVCVLNINYVIHNNLDKGIGDFAMNVEATQSAMGKIYAQTELLNISGDGKTYNASQIIIADRIDISDAYFEDELPLGFRAPYAYNFSYKVDGDSSPRTGRFLTSSK